MTDLPHSPDELLDRLFTIFPRFRTSYDGPIYEGAPTYDSVLTTFTTDFGVEFSSSADDQLRSFAALVNDAIDIGGELGDAFATCFLDHIRQIHLNESLWPYLSNAARERA
jgi:hypothetical protein